MAQKFRSLLFYLLSSVAGILICSSVLGSASNGLFSDKNFQALKEDPTILFSKANSCRLKSILGEKDFKAFRETMPLLTVDDDEPGYLSIAGNVRGLFTIMEGYLRLSKSGQVWIAYLQDDKVHYFTNDNATLNQPPKNMMKWSERFKDAKWLNNAVTVGIDTCG